MGYDHAASSPSCASWGLFQLTIPGLVHNHTDPTFVRVEGIPMRLTASQGPCPPKPMEMISCQLTMFDLPVKHEVTSRLGSHG